jgi:hypothetical protein
VSTVKDVQVDHNGGDGLFIAQTAAMSTVDSPCDPAFVLAGDRPTLRSKTAIHDNAGNGITAGSTDDTVQGGAICALLGDADVFTNGGSGISVAEPAGMVSEVHLVADDVYTNLGNGLLVGPSRVGQVAAVGDAPQVATFSRNKFHSNKLNQAVFDGGGAGGGGAGDPNSSFVLDSPGGTCGVDASAFFCYGPNQTFGIFAQGNATVAVHHCQFQDASPGMSDVSAQSGSSITVDTSCDAMTVCP